MRRNYETYRNDSFCNRVSNCCTYKVVGKARICPGFFLPNPVAQVNGPLAQYFSGDLNSNSKGRYWGAAKAPLGCYDDNYVTVTGDVTQSGQAGDITLTYSGTSRDFDLCCFVIGAKVKARQNTKVNLQ